MCNIKLILLKISRH